MIKIQQNVVKNTKKALILYEGKIRCMAAGQEQDKEYEGLDAISIGEKVLTCLGEEATYFLLDIDEYINKK